MKYILLIYLLSPGYTLYLEGVIQGVQSIRTGQPSPILQRKATEHAEYMARVQSMGHQGWSQRVYRLSREMPGYQFQEVVAVSSERDEKEAAREIFRAWRSSRPHWSAVNGKCDFYWYAMAYNNGAWYATAIFATRR
jgi:uncharacterized protein YkwD